METILPKIIEYITEKKEKGEKRYYMIIFDDINLNEKSK
jgi:hypothetical protein